MLKNITVAVVSLLISTPVMASENFDYFNQLPDSSRVKQLCGSNQAGSKQCVEFGEVYIPLVERLFYLSLENQRSACHQLAKICAPHSDSPSLMAIDLLSHECSKFSGVEGAVQEQEVNQFLDLILARVEKKYAEDNCSD